MCQKFFLDSMKAGVHTGTGGEDLPPKAVSPPSRIFKTKMKFEWLEVPLKRLRINLNASIFPKFLGGGRGNLLKHTHTPPVSMQFLQFPSPVSKSCMNPWKVLFAFNYLLRVRVLKIFRAFNFCTVWHIGRFLNNKTF